MLNTPLSIPHSIPYSIHRGNLILVNAAHPYAELAGERPQLASLNPQDGQTMLRPAAAALNSLLERLFANAACGWQQIAAVSGWRSLAEQQEIYRQSAAANGPEFTARFVALPGCSEHQTGLAIDLGRRQEEIDFIRPDFPRSGIFQRFRQLAPDYGFVERYLPGKERICGIAPEPWHFRYVGRPHAALLQREGLALEEYIELLHLRPLVYQGEAGRAAVRRLPEGAELPSAPSVQISGDNVDGWIITQWQS